MTTSMKTMLIFYTLLLAVLSCSQKEPGPRSNISQQKGGGIVGTWRLYEIGSSVGGGTVDTTIVPAHPSQTLTFNARGGLSKEGDRLGDYFNYPLYQIDSTRAGYQLLFIANRADTTGYKVNVSIEKDNMVIMPFCVEGCYLKFVKIK